MALATSVNIARSVVNHQTGRVELPNMCTFIVTWRCNLRCFMCDVWKKTDHDDMTTDGVEHVFKQIQTRGALRTNMCKLFLRCDLTGLTLVSVEATNPTLVDVTTAGVLTDR